LSNILVIVIRIFDILRLSDACSDAGGQKEGAEIYVSIFVGTIRRIDVKSVRDDRQPPTTKRLSS